MSRIFCQKDGETLLWFIWQIENVEFLRPGITRCAPLGILQVHRSLASRFCRSEVTLWLYSLYWSLSLSFSFSLSLSLSLAPDQCPEGRIFQCRVGSGRVLDKIPGSGSGSGRVGVSKNTIGYFRVSFLLSGISGYFGYFGYFWVFLVYPYILRLFSNIYWGLKRLQQNQTGFR